MSESERLRGLAARVRLGEPVNWGAELDAMALDQVANDAEFSEQIQKQSSRQLERFSGISHSGPETAENGSS